MQEPATTRTFQQPSYQYPISNHGLKYKAQSFRLALAAALFHLRSRWQTTMCIWRGAFGSFLGHIRILSPTELLVAHCGPASVESPAGARQPNTRTNVRMKYITALRVRHQWLDIVDLRIFLMGFDAGEQFAHHTAGTETRTPVVVPSWDSYFQLSRADKGQISPVSPAAIAGVTRNDE
jgi:hypothetical protein